MGAFWNPHGGVVLNDKKLSKNEVSDLKENGWHRIIVLWALLLSGGKNSKWL